MNGRQFLASLRRYAGEFDWELQHDGGPLRGRGKDTVREFCPITAVCFVETGKFFEPLKYRLAARRLGLAEPQDIKTVLAADGACHHNAAHRAALIRATGLSEQKAVKK